MSELIFPSEFKCGYTRTNVCDFIPEGFQLSNIASTYRALSGSCIKIFIDTSNVTNMSYMFQNGSKLLSVPFFDTSNVTNMSYMFYGCKKLLSVPLFDTNKVTDMSYMFYDCDEISSIPLFDTSTVTNMHYIFYNCKKITTIPLFDTSKVYQANSMFDGCVDLTSVPELDFSSLSYMSSFFGSAYQLSKLTDLGGFKNLGAQSYISGTNTNYFLNMCPNLTYESIMNVINNLYDRASAGYSTATLKLHTNAMALLSDDDKAIATNKGWTLA